MKINAAWFGNTLLPQLKIADTNGIDIRSKSELLGYFSESEEESFWVCCSSAQDIEDTADLVSAIEGGFEFEPEEMDQATSPEIPLEQLAEAVVKLDQKGQYEISAQLKEYISARSQQELSKLAQVIWDSKLVNRDVTKDNLASIKKFAKEAKALLDKKLQGYSEDDKKEIVMSVIEDLFNEDPSYSGPEIRNVKQVLSEVEEVEAKKKKSNRKHLYYMGEGDDLDKLETCQKYKGVNLNSYMKDVDKFIPKR